MFKKIPDDVMKNDSIIILEYYTDGLSRYSCTIYESEDKTERGYTVATSIKDRVVVIDSLRSIRLKDDILPMVLKGQLQKIVEEGKKTTLTPGGRLIITILRKEENKNKFNIQTVKSFKFIVKEN
ncbi:hypothetical protein LJB80_01585 [Bacteroides sp. OttesenSCG-928-F21]|nr:hypothetical protein [Bacteroides sp. OttesenSCG-928-F21]